MLEDEATPTKADRALQVTRTTLHVAVLCLPLMFVAWYSAGANLRDLEKTCKSKAEVYVLNRSAWRFYVDEAERNRLANPHADYARITSFDDYKFVYTNPDLTHKFAPNHIYESYAILYKARQPIALISNYYMHNDSFGFHDGFDCIGHYAQFYELTRQRAPMLS